MLGITVRNFLDCMYGWSVVHIYVNGYTYEFQRNKITNEILNTRVDSIDDPYNNEEPHQPLCLNLDSMMFMDDEPALEFYNRYKEHIVAG